MRPPWSDPQDEFLDNMGNTVFLIGPGDVIGFVMELGGSIGHCNSETGVADKAKVVVTVSHSYHLAAVYAEGGD